jgi:hypothetical protein
MSPDGPGLSNGSDVELLDTRPPRPGRRRRQALIGAVLAVTAGTVIAVRSAGGGEPGPSRPTSPGGHSSPVGPSSPAGLAPSAGPAVVASVNLAFARVGDTLYAVDAGTLVTIDLNSGRRIEHAAAGVVPSDRYELLADPPAHRLWLVGSTDTRTVVMFVDPTTLAVTGRHETQGQFMDAAALDGRLYLATVDGVSVVSQSPGPRAVAPPAVHGMPLALGADPTRHRILVVLAGDGEPRLVAWTPVCDRLHTAIHPPVGKGDIVIAGGRIWAAGYGEHGVLARLDPGTLRVVRHSAVEQEVGVGAVVVDAGPKHLLVRSGGGTGEGSGSGFADLWCVDAGSGAIVRHWSPATGTAVLTERGIVLFAPNEPMQRLPSGSCRG